MYTFIHMPTFLTHSPLHIPHSSHLFHNNSLHLVSNRKPIVFIYLCPIIHLVPIFYSIHPTLILTKHNSPSPYPIINRLYLTRNDFSIMAVLVINSYIILPTPLFSLISYIFPSKGWFGGFNVQIAPHILICPRILTCLMLTCPGILMMT